MKLSELVARLSSAGIGEAEAEARILFSHFGGFSPASLFGQDPSFSSGALEEAALRRTAREPLAYILGEAPFYRSILKVTPDCLIPRADTERLCELAIERLPRGARFCDLCTGSGAIAVTVLSERPDTTAHALDISPAAIAVAEENARRLGVLDRLSLSLGDVFSDASLPQGPFNAILSNPPYIESGVLPTLSPEVASEPRIALDGGEDGLRFYRRILTLADRLSPGGFLLLECGYDQEAGMAALSADAGLSFSPYYDYGGNFRCALLTR